MIRVIIGIWIFFCVACTFTKTVETGQSAYNLKQYSRAIEFLHDEFENTTGGKKAQTAYFLGKSYQQLHDSKNAIVWFQTATDLDYGVDAMRQLAAGYKMLEQYDHALNVYYNIRDEIGKNEIIDREISICKQLSSFYHDDETVTINIKGVKQNTKYADYAPVIYNEKYLVFTSDRGLAVGDEVYDWTGNSYSDIFIQRKSGSRPKSFDKQVNTTFNEGAACFTKDGSTMYFTRCSGSLEDDNYCRIMVSHKDEDEWSDPHILNFIVDGYNYGQPALIENDSVMIFSSDANGDHNGHDLFYSELLEENEWSAPEPMPSSINSQGDEKFPTAEGDTLYFSSNYLAGLGGYDIFMTVLHDNHWSKPVNMKTPINSGGDDFSYILDKSSRRNEVLKAGYFSSTRNGDTDDDIFRFEVVKTKLYEKKKEDKEPEIKEFTVFLAGKVVDATGRPLELAEVIIMEGDKSLFDINTDNKGLFIRKINRDLDLKIIAGKSGYLTNSIESSSKDLITKNESITINVEITLDKLIKNREIVIEDIFYEFDRWEIRNDAIPSLDKLVKMLRDNPQVNIELSSHTDCRGNDAYNQSLSQKRAQSAVDYLVGEGISRLRLIPSGYGETKFAIRCDCEECSEDDHQANRRTAFTILD